MSALSVFVSERATFLREYEAGVARRISLVIRRINRLLQTVGLLFIASAVGLSVAAFVPAHGACVLVFLLTVLNAGVCIDCLRHDRPAVGLHQVSHFCRVHHPHQCLFFSCMDPFDV